MIWMCAESWKWRPTLTLEGFYSINEFLIMTYYYEAIASSCPTPPFSLPAPPQRACFHIIHITGTNTQRCLQNRVTFYNRTHSEGYFYPLLQSSTLLLLLFFLPIRLSPFNLALYFSPCLFDLVLCLHGQQNACFSCLPLLFLSFLRFSLFPFVPLVSLPFPRV